MSNRIPKGGTYTEAIIEKLNNINELQLMIINRYMKHVIYLLCKEIQMQNKKFYAEAGIKCSNKSVHQLLPFRFIHHRHRLFR